MRLRSIIIGTCLVGTLTGLGYLAWYLYGDTEDTDSSADLPDIEQTAAAQNNHKPTKQRPSKTVPRTPIPHKPLKTVPRTPIPHRPPKTTIRLSGKQRPQPKTSPKTQKVDIPAARLVPPPQGDEFPLRLGSKGKRVERLQVWLMRNFGWTGKITDVFDKKTENLLKRVLKKTQLDEATYNRMKMGKSVHQQPVYKRTTIRRPVYRKPVYNPTTIDRQVHRQPTIQHIRR